MLAAVQVDHRHSTSIVCFDWVFDESYCISLGSESQMAYPSVHLVQHRTDRVLDLAASLLDSSHCNLSIRRPIRRDDVVFQFARSAAIKAGARKAASNADPSPAVNRDRQF
jgi:hypothetical protein